MGGNGSPTVPSEAPSETRPDTSPDRPVETQNVATPKRGAVAIDPCLSAGMSVCSGGRSAATLREEERGPPLISGVQGGGENPRKLVNALSASLSFK